MAGRVPAISLYAAGLNPRGWFHRVSMDFDAQGKRLCSLARYEAVYNAQILTICTIVHTL